VPQSFHPFENGKCIVHWPDEKRLTEEIAQFSLNDATNFPKFVAHMNDVIPFVRRLLFETPIDPTTGKLKDIARSLRFAWDLLTLSAHEYLCRWFESDEVLTYYGSYASGAAGLISPKTPGFWRAL
jgi:phytoene dehydrogenase-like protein